MMKKEIRRIGMIGLIAILPLTGRGLIISNMVPTNVTTTSAYFRVEVLSTNGTGTNPTLSVRFGTVDNTTNLTGWQNTNSYGVAGVGSVSTQITGLTAANRYYYRWRAVEGTADVWAANGTTNFYTKPIAPTTTPTMVSHAVTVDTNGNLKAPTNLWLQNRTNIINGIGALTNEVDSAFTNWLSTNTYIKTNTGNWAGTWQGLGTNEFANKTETANATNAMLSAQANTNAGFNSRLVVVETGKQDLAAQTSTNAGFETRIIAVTTGKQDLAAQTSTNAGFETRIVTVETGKQDLAAQTSTNAGFETRINLSQTGAVMKTGGTMSGNLDMGTNNVTNLIVLGFTGGVEVTAGKVNLYDTLDESTNALNTRANNLETSTNALNTRMAAVETGKQDLAAQTSTNAGFESRINLSQTGAVMKTGGTMSGNLILGGNVITGATYYGDAGGLTNLTGSEPLWVAASNQVQTDINALEIATNALNTRTASLETSTNALNTRAANLETSTNALNSSVTNLNNSTNALNTRANNLEAATNNLNATKLNLAGGTMTAPLTNTYGYYGDGVGLTNIAGTAGGWSGFAATQAVNLASNIITNAVSIDIRSPMDGIAIGRGASLNNSGVAIGSDAKADQDALSVGYHAIAQLDSSAFGNFAYASNYSVALGYGAEGWGENGVAIGHRARANGPCVAIGYGITNAESETTKLYGRLNMADQAITGVSYLAMAGPVNMGGNVISNANYVQITNRIAFQAVRSANILTTAGVWSNINCNVVKQNDGGGYDGATYRFTAPRNGTYILSAGVAFKWSADQTATLVAIFVNNSLAHSTFVNTSGSRSGPMVTWVGVATQGMFFEPKYYVGATNAFGSGDVSGNETWFTGGTFP